MDIKELQKINLNTNDVLVATFNMGSYNTEDLNVLKSAFSSVIKDNKMVIIGLDENSNMKLEAINQNSSVKVNIKKLHTDAIIPKYQTSGASGFDFHALEDVHLEPGETKLVKTGLSFEIPEGYELQVRPRSGLSLSTGLRVANSPGTCDSDFRGEVCVIMNLSPVNGFNIPYTIKKNDRIAQGVICPVIKVEFEETEELKQTNRNIGSFGSTGK